MEKFLGASYGLIVYQDDLLIMAHDLAGYTWGEVDKFRKAVGKKIPAEMAKQYKKFTKADSSSCSGDNPFDRVWKIRIIAKFDKSIGRATEFFRKKYCKLRGN